MLLTQGDNGFPSTIEGILRGFGEVTEFQIIVDRRDAMADLGIELEPGYSTQPANGTDPEGKDIQSKLHFRPIVSLLPPRTLRGFEMKGKRLAIRA